MAEVAAALETSAANPAKGLAPEKPEEEVAADGASPADCRPKGGR